MMSTDRSDAEAPTPNPSQQGAFEGESFQTPPLTKGGSGGVGPTGDAVPRKNPPVSPLRKGGRGPRISGLCPPPDPKATRTLLVLGRLARLLLLGLVGAIIGIVLSLLYDMTPMAVPQVRRWVLMTLLKGTVLAVLAVVGVTTAWVVLPRRVRSWIDGGAAWFLNGPATVLAALTCLGLVATWLPHYLTWPWWSDADQFAVSAQSWAAGLVPYRDLPDFDFPGPIYELYVLGRLFGWGRTAPYYALDAAFLVLLGVALAAWSRRMFGRMLPGLVAYVPFLCHYLGFDYIQVAQRDWHGPFFAVLALLALEAVPGRAGRLASALAMAAGLAYRPQVVLFFPALVAALDEAARRDDEPWTRTIPALAGWCAAFAGSLVLVFSPLIWEGALDDFVVRLGMARYGGSYNHATWQGLMMGIRRQLGVPWTFGVLAAGGLLSFAGPPARRRTARTWILAALGALLYKPISPVPHAYLDQPLLLMRSLNLAPLAAWWLALPAPIAPLRLGAIAALVVAVLPREPMLCSVETSLRAARTLARGEEAIDPPPGCARYYSDRPGRHYRGDDYRRLLAYLRTSIPRQTRVANFLRAHPYPTVNGPTAHLSTFPAAAGILFLSAIDPGREEAFIEALEHTPDSVVVWVPGEIFVDPRLRLPRMVQAIRKWYRPLARFGNLEVWAHAARSGR
jgi:hypothetical protein